MTNILFRAGLVLGLGLGGFFDGIVLHQILGWHHLVCYTATCRPNSVAELQRQTVQDGFFHLACLGLTLAGAVLLFRAARRTDPAAWTGRALVGALLAGWGMFNFVEGLIDHQILGIHHVRPGQPGEFLADMLFLASGVGFFAVGWLLARPLNAPASRGTLATR